MAPDPHSVLAQIKAISDQGLIAVCEPCHCPHCGYYQTYLHASVEVITCESCGGRFESLVPRLLTPGEPDAMDYELALEEMSQAFPDAARWLRDRATSLAVARA